MAATTARKKIVGTLLLVMVPLVLLYNWLTIFDWIRLFGYEPPAHITEITEQTGMTDKAKNLFFVHHPVVEPDKATFSGRCNEAEKTIVLGCYIRGNGIYLYDVDDPRLAGIIEVTAAHEMLHAAYDRLSNTERDDLNQQLQAVFAALDNDRLKKTIEAYRAADPSSVPNELHSILGSEVRTLTPTLEEYYARYFFDRLAVVGLAEKYEQAFTSREQQREAYDKELETLKGNITQLNESLGARETIINQQYSSLINLRNQGFISDFNAGIDAYNQNVNEYNNDVRTVQELIKTYNEIVEKRNELVIEENQLIQALDSRPSTLQTQ